MIISMPPRRTRKVSQDSEGQPDYDQKIRLNKRKELFIQQFEKEGQSYIEVNTYSFLYMY